MKTSCKVALQNGDTFNNSHMICSKYLACYCATVKLILLIRSMESYDVFMYQLSNFDCKHFINHNHMSYI